MKILTKLLTQQSYSLWNYIIITYAGFYSTLFGAFFANKYFSIPRSLVFSLPLFLLFITAVQGWRIISTYSLVERTKNPNLPDFTLQNFSESTWIKLSNKSPYLHKLNLSSGTTILLEDIPLPQRSKIASHVVAVGNLNGLRRMSLPIRNENKVGLLKLALALLSTKNPSRGYIYGSLQKIEYFADEYRKTFGTSVIEVFREYEREEHSEYYLSLGSILADALLDYYDHLNINDLSQSALLGISEALITAFGRIVSRPDGPHYRPPKITIKNTPNSARYVLARCGILTRQIKDGFVIPASEFQKLFLLDLPDEFINLTKSVGTLNEPLRSYNVAASILAFGYPSEDSLNRIGRDFYGKSIVSLPILQRYKQNGFCTTENGRLLNIDSLPNYFGSEYVIVEAYAEFLCWIRSLKVQWNEGFGSWKSEDHLMTAERNLLHTLTLTQRALKKAELENKALRKLLSNSDFSIDAQVRALLIGLILAIKDSKISLDSILKAESYDLLHILNELIQNLEQMQEQQTLFCTNCNIHLDCNDVFAHSGTCPQCGEKTDSLQNLITPELLTILRDTCETFR
ncbi:MAG: hypothetical protein ACFFCQ_12145 [Promethearchaeota archaeon]